MIRLFRSPHGKNMTSRGVLPRTECPPVAERVDARVAPASPSGPSRPAGLRTTPGHHDQVESLTSWVLPSWSLRNDPSRASYLWVKLDGDLGLLQEGRHESHRHRGNRWNGFPKVFHRNLEVLVHVRSSSDSVYYTKTVLVLSKVKL